MEFNELIKKVAETLELTPAEILQPSRKRKLVEARCIIYTLLDRQNEHPSDIAERFKQDRTTVIFGIAKAQNLLTYDRYFKTKFGKCADAVGQSI